MEELVRIVASLTTLGVAIYALLLVAGAPFSGPKLANNFAKWIGNGVINFTIKIITFPFRLVFGGKKKKKKRRRDGFKL